MEQETAQQPTQEVSQHSEHHTRRFFYLLSVLAILILLSTLFFINTNQSLPLEEVPTLPSSAEVMMQQTQENLSIPQITEELSSLEQELQEIDSTSLIEAL